MTKKDKPEAMPTPYPGLRYYRDNQAAYFAGRDDATAKCTQLLGTAPILILHGRSGCGKSSFLRAGVKPRLREADHGQTFPENFEVVRCSENPLHALSDMLVKVCETFIEQKGKGFWKTKPGVEAEDIAEFASLFAKRRKKIASEADSAYEVLVKFSRLLTSHPILVIDQSEEIFTHEEKKSRRLNTLDPGGEGAKSDLSDVEREEYDALNKRRSELSTATGEFFQFLGRVAERGAGGARIVISLRTEYKGQLDDRIPTLRKGTRNIRSFYLEDLAFRGLVAAIRRPTLQGAEWEAFPGAAGQPSPFEHWGFRLGRGVAEKLARQLTNTQKVPEGGILPTLQVACLRLWELASERKDDDGTFTITNRHLERIGQIDTQIQEYISQRLDRACEGAANAIGEWPEGTEDAAERWNGLLFDQLVEVQADGRAVSVTTTEKDLAEEARTYFRVTAENDDVTRSATAVKRAEADRDKRIEAVIETLLKSDVALLNRGREKGNIALGHDSVALSLNKWSIRYNRDDSMMTRLRMGGARQPDTYTEEDLYPTRPDADIRSSRSKKSERDGPNRDKPHRTRIILQHDQHWDRQYAHFAFHKHFARRLGIDFVVDREDLDLAGSGETAPKTWDVLRRRLNDEEKRTQATRMHKSPSKRENVRVMAAADWHSFPRMPSRRKQATPEEIHAEEQQQVSRWTDILVTNLFTGNGLIGPRYPLKNELDRKGAMNAEDPGAEFKKTIKESLDALVANDGEVCCHDQLAYDFLQKAGSLAGDDAVIKYLNNEENLRVFTRRRGDTSQYPLADWFLTRSKRPRFIVGTASTRALALQADGKLYFSTSELTRVVRSDIDAARGGKVEHDLIEEIQRVIKHTTWQLGIPPAQWNQGRNRALVLRLASIGYFTVEHIRSNADDFVRYICNQTNTRLGGDNEAENYKGVRINRDTVRDAVRDCYSIFRFDEIGSEFYDLDSTIAYRTRHAEYDSVSAAGEIYCELATLRQQTLVHYEAISRMIVWLKDRGGYQPDSLVTLRSTELKTCAWHHFRIFNFFDSERYMAEAVLLLQRDMEGLEYGETLDA